MACSHSPTCPLFAQFQLNSTLRSWKIMYCDSDARSKNCQRFKLSGSGQTVPLNLLPNGTMLDVGTAPSPAGGCGPATVPATPATAARPSAPVLPVSIAAPLSAAARAAPVPVAAPAVPVSVAAHAAPMSAAAPAAAPTTIRPSAPALPRAPATAAGTPNAAAPVASARARSILDRILGRKA